MTAIKVLDADSIARTVPTLTELMTMVSTQATSAAILAKLIATPSTEAKQDTGNTSLASIDTKMTTIAGYVDGLESLATALNGYVDGLETLIGTTNSGIANLTTVFGSAALDQGSGATTTHTLRTTIATDQFAAAGPQTAANSTATIDSGSGIASSWGVSGVPVTSANQSASAAACTDAPVTGQKIVIDDLIVSSDTAMSITFTEETSGTVVFGPWYIPASAGPIQLTPRGKKKLATTNKRLMFQTSVAGNVTVQPSYHSEA